MVAKVRQGNEEGEKWGPHRVHYPGGAVSQCPDKARRGASWQVPLSLHTHYDYSNIAD